MTKPNTVLTDEEIEKGRAETFSVNNPFCPCDSKTMRKAARWAEQAVLAKQAAQVEPVAWRPKSKDGIQFQFVTGVPRSGEIELWKSRGCEIEYAYAEKKNQP